MPKPALDFAMLPTALRGDYNFNFVACVQDNVWTHGDEQVVVFWDYARRPRITKRVLPDGPWSTPVDLSVAVPSPVANDAHNDIVVGVDSLGYVHVAGNMHNHPLRYARSNRPGLDLAGGFTARTMTGVDEDSVSYPQFFMTGTGRLMFTHRNGVSGNGNQYLKRLDDPATGRWVRATPTAMLIDGIFSGESPYMQRWDTDATGIHAMWCWRETGSSADTNTDLSYARSPDEGATWFAADGTRLTLPIRHTTPGVLARDLPHGSGLVNTNGSCVDMQGRPHAVYTQFDARGATQIAHTWWDGAAWRHELLTTSLTYRMETRFGLIDTWVSRPTIVCGADGRLWAIFRTQADGRRGTVRAVEATPGAVHRHDFPILRLDLAQWEPAYDGQAATRRNELHMLVGTAITGPGSPDYDNAGQWDRQWGAVLTIDLAQMSELQAGKVRLPRMATLGTAGSVNGLVVTATTDTDVPQAGLMLSPGKLPAEKSRWMFGRWRGRAQLLSRATSSSWRLRLNSGVEVQDQAVLTFTTAAHQVLESPWAPFDEFSTAADTPAWLVLRGSTNAGASTRFTAFTMELGYVDF